MVKKVEDMQQENEIEDYESLRSIGASEACWRIFGFKTNEVCPTVQALPIHRENGQRVPFEEGQETMVVEAGPPQTELTMWFHYNITQINKPFGGKTFVLARDFCQTLPIIQHGS